MPHGQLHIERVMGSDSPACQYVAKGRLEALINFQTMIADLTGLPIANASLLDEGTAAAEAMTMMLAASGLTDSSKQNKAIFISQDCHPQTIEVVKTRAQAVGIPWIVGDHTLASFSFDSYFGILLSLPNTYGEFNDETTFIQKAHSTGVKVTIISDALSLTVLKSPGEMGADICVGSTQNFGIPMGMGGPHAAFMSAQEEYKRIIPGRIIGISKDSQGNVAYRLALQTREQHIRREKATSNICTAQVLLAIMASFYAVYHGPDGLKKIAFEIFEKTQRVKKILKNWGYEVKDSFSFHTVVCKLSKETELNGLLKKCESKKINIRKINSLMVSVTLDETVTQDDLMVLLNCFAPIHELTRETFTELFVQAKVDKIPEGFNRKSTYLQHPVFNRYHTETEMLRYITRLQSKDLSLAQSMIPLGSCTMKLNATTEMLPITWPEFSNIHPFAPQEQIKGYLKLFKQLESFLSAITGFSGISLQPNAGSQGEFAGLLAIKRYLNSKNQGHRHICLIPQSAHGTNPASAVMVGFKVVVVACDSNGNIDVEDLSKKAKEHEKDLAALMVTYPSTHGVFEEKITEICKIIHDHGGQVYMDGANLNAQVGLSQPAQIGADVCHLNLHKTFCIPHGGGGPGVGPIGVKDHLIPFLPGHFTFEENKKEGAVASAPWGSASILPISYSYILLMGGEGLKKATEVAILNANYIAQKLEPYYPVLYKGKAGRVAHECIIDIRGIKQKSGVDVEDIAKRLMDYGYHAPTVSFPVAGTMMIEPTESESKAECDRFCEALILIRKEIEAIEDKKWELQQSPLKKAPHTAMALCQSEWNLPYSREQAAFPASWLKDYKFWPSVSRIDNVFGDRNLVCTCSPIEDYQA